MKNLLESLEKTNVKYFVFSSSSEVYGEISCKNGAYETDNPEPKSLYGHSKIIGEHLIKSYSGIFNFNYLKEKIFIFHHFYFISLKFFLLQKKIKNNLFKSRFNNKVKKN
jgi:GDP-D-mannose dehydratase